MQERNFCSKSMIVTSDANDFVLEKAMQERDLCWQGNHYVTSPSSLFLQLSLSPELQENAWWHAQRLPFRLWFLSVKTEDQNALSMEPVFLMNILFEILYDWFLIETCPDAYNGWANLFKIIRFNDEDYSGSFKKLTIPSKCLCRIIVHIL